MAKQQGANGSQPREFPIILCPYLAPPPHNLKSGPYPLDKSQCLGYGRCQTIVATPLPRDENLRAPRYHDLSCERLKQKCHVPSEHLVPQTDVSKHGTLVNRSEQNFCLQGGVNNASGPEVSRYSSSREAVPADRKSISETPRSVRVPSPESPVECWI
jgi:hypothetical protein